MKAKNVIGIVVLVITVAFATTMVQQNRVDARQVAARAGAGVVVYALLEVKGPDKVSWRVGGNEVVRVESVQRTIQRLGGTGDYEFIDLLNQIGQNGWTLQQIDGENWIFTR